MEGKKPRKDGGVNPDELGPAQPREVDQPDKAPMQPDQEDGGKPFGTPDRPAPDQPVLPSTGVP